MVESLCVVYLWTVFAGDFFCTCLFTKYSVTLFSQMEDS